MALPSLPPLPTLGEEKEEPKSYVLNQQSIIQGNIEYEMERARSSSYTIPEADPTSFNDAADRVSRDINDTAVQKDGPWWAKALGWLEPLKYIDIPMELGVELVEGVIPGKWAGEGTAERQDFEAWKALFGKDTSEATGWGEFKNRIDLAAAATEKRPLWSQIGIGALQIGATFGAGFAATALAKGGTTAAKVAAIATRTTGGVLDPAEYGLRALGKIGKVGFVNTKRLTRNITTGARRSKYVTVNGVRGYWRTTETGDQVFKRAYDAEDWYQTEAVMGAEYDWLGPFDPLIGGGSGEMTYKVMGVEALHPFRGDSNWEEIQFIFSGDNLSAGNTVFGPYATAKTLMVGGEETIIGGANRYGYLIPEDAGLDAIPNIIEADPNARYHIPINPDTPWGKVGDLPPILQISNDFYRLEGDLWEYAKILKNPEARLSPERMEALQDLAALRINHAMSVRPGQVQGATIRHLKEFAAEGYHGRFKLQEGRGKALEGDRTGIAWPDDDGETWIAVNEYLEALEEWKLAKVGTQGKEFGAFKKGGKGAKNYGISDDSPAFGYDFKSQSHTQTKVSNIARIKKFSSNIDPEDDHYLKSLDNPMNESSGFNRRSVNEGNYDLTVDAKRIRNLRSSERYLEGEEIADIAQKLGHSPTSYNILRTYIMDIENYTYSRILGAMQSLHFERLRIPSEIIARLNADPALAEKIARVQEITANRVSEVNSFRANPEWGNKIARKGYDEADFAKSSEIIATGELYLDDLESLSYFFDGPLETKLDELDSMSIPSFGDDVAPSVGGNPRPPITIAKETMKLKALRRMTLQMGLGYQHLEFKRKAISSVATSISERGKLQKAGFDVHKVGNEGKIDWVDANNKVLMGPDAIKYRAQFARETGMDKYLPPDPRTKADLAPWIAWADNLIIEHNGINDILRQHGRAMKIDKNGVISPTGTPAFAVLSEYIDSKAISLYDEWTDLPKSVKDKMPAILEEVTELRFVGSGFTDNLHRMGRKGWGASAAVQAARFLKRYIKVHPNLVDPSTKTYFAPLLDENEFTSKALQDTLKDWVNEEGIGDAFNAYNVNINSSVDKLKETLHKMAKFNTGLFGKHFENPSVGFLKQDLKTKKFVLTDKGERFLDNIAERIANNRGILDNYRTDRGGDVKKSLFEEMRERRIAPKPLRVVDLEGRGDFWERLMDGGGDRWLNGISPTYLAGGLGIRITDTMSLVDRVDPEGMFGKMVEVDDGPIKHIMDYAVRPLTAMFRGGAGILVREVNVPILAAGHHFRMTERESVRIARIIKTQLIDNLGLEMGEVTDEMRKAGLKGANETFTVKSKGGLIVKPLQEIRDFEELDFTRRVYAEMSPQKQKKGAKLPPKKFIPTLQKIEREVLGTPPPDEYGALLPQGHLQDVNNLLRQVDVVLERIPPKFWGRYFELTQRQHDTLRWIKEFQEAIDQNAMKKGVLIPEAIADRGGEYLRNYFPRLIRMVSDRIFLGQRAKPIKLLNKFNPFFEMRARDDVLDALKADTVSDLQRINPKNLHRAVFEPIDQRLGMYYEALTKEGIIVETKAALKETAAYKKGADASEATSRAKALNAIEEVLNARLAGKGLLQSKLLDKIREENTSNWGAIYGWLAEDNMKVVAKAQREQESIRDFISYERTKLKDIWEDMGQGYTTITDTWLDGILQHMPKADQQSMANFLEERAGFFGTPVLLAAKTLAPVSQFFRALKASFDFGAPLIHGFNSLVKTPWKLEGGKWSFDGQKAWGKSLKAMFQMFVDPDVLRQFMVMNNDEILHATQLGRIMLGETEPLGALASGSGALRFLREWFGENIPLADQVKAADRFESSFIGFTDSLRIEAWKGMSPSVTRALKADGYIDDIWIQRGMNLNEVSEAAARMAEAGKLSKDQISSARGVVQKAYHELGAAINKSTGVFDQDLAGMTPFQRIVESSMIFFAPMYRRATFGILADLRKGGIRRREAIRQLGGVVAMGGMMAFLADKLGNNPRSLETDERGIPNITARFGKFNIGGYQMGFGTAWWTVFRVAADLAMMPMGEEDYVEQEDWINNPLMEMMQRKGRSQLAPGAGYLVDIFAGRTFTGDPLRDFNGEWNVKENILHLSRQPLPFWLDISVTSGWGVAAAIPAELFGLQAYRISDFDKLAKAREGAINTWEKPEVKEWRDKQLRAGAEVSWIAAPKIVKMLIEDYNPTVLSAKQNYEETYGPIAQGNNRLFREYQQEKSSLDLAHKQRLANAQNQFQTGVIDGMELNRIIGEVKYSRRASNGALLNAPRYHPLKEYFVQIRNGRSKKDVAFELDILYDLYQSEVVHNPNHMDEDGNYNYASFETSKQLFFEDYQVDDEQWQYLVDRSQFWLEGLDVIKAFEESKVALRPYWTAHKILFPIGHAMAGTSRRFYELPRSQRDALMQQFPALRTMDNKVKKFRLKIRDANPMIDWNLVKWWGNSPRHASSLAQQRKWHQEQLNNKLTTKELIKARDFTILPSGRIGMKTQMSELTES